MASGPGHTVGGALDTCLKAARLSTKELAVCLIGKGFAPSGVADESALSTILADVLAGNNWPFSVTDTTEFFVHCQTCLKRAGSRKLFALSLFGALLVQRLLRSP